MTPAQAFADCIARLGPPPPGVEIVFQRVYAGAPLAEMRLVGERPFVHYQSRERPTDVPDGAQWTTATMQNLDGGPGLRNEIAILDLPHPHCREDVDALARRWPAFLDVPRLVGEVHAALAAWGAKPPRKLTWLSRRFPTETGMLGDRHPGEPLGQVLAAVRELSPGILERTYSAAAGAWQALADRGEVWPRETDDSYYPGIWIADGWVGKRIAETPNPFPAVLALGAYGFWVDAVVGDETFLLLPRDD